MLLPLRIVSAVVFIISLFFVYSAAEAQTAEMRVGANIHDIEILGFGTNKEKENSVAINAELVFEEPQFLKWALSPQPYIGGTYNLEGNTSYGGGGLLWRQGFGNKFYGDFSFGLVIHNGNLEFDRPTTPAESLVFQEQTRENIEFGSRILFRQQIALGYRFNKTYSAEFFIEHLSHGRILSSRSNEGLDVIGGRVAKRF
ncbi:acyloxyacyl hydrolase [Litorimonas haliclonae]|uniref:acyloxyacyl hydrolase n=1 Tax=Litorimonas haliclonae TaxID=2081977 RepID=UPI0039EF4405